MDPLVGDLASIREHTTAFSNRWEPQLGDQVRGKRKSPGITGIDDDFRFHRLPLIGENGEVKYGFTLVGDRALDHWILA